MNKTETSKALMELIIAALELANVTLEMKAKERKAEKSKADNGNNQQ